MVVPVNTVLSDEAVTKIEARALEVKELVGVGQFGEDMLALCHTVKALRSEIVTSDEEWQARLAEVERERDELRAELEERGKSTGLVAEALSNEASRRID